MACRAAHSWTFCSLVGAFLDLALAYFMLCGAACAFLAAKFLGVFGLRLPCPCGGLFGRPNGQCPHSLLVDYPPRIVSSVQMSVRSRFPFGSVSAEEEGSPRQFDVRLVRDGAQSNRLLEMARDEAESCGSVSNWNAGLQNSSSAGPSTVKKGDGHEVVRFRWRPRGGSDVKGKRVLSSLKPRVGLGRRRRAAVEQRKSSPILPCDPQLGWQETQQSYHSMSEQMQEISEENVSTSNSGDHHPLSDNLKLSDSIGMVGGDFPVTGSIQQLASGKAAEKNLACSAAGEHTSERNEADTTRILEQALKEEQAARSALYLELEKERSAAATAADEAMAMILRLQKEKASIEMEARQYRRMVEEKSAYDEVEMNILKEIIVRREREKLSLEKEVELYRQMIISGEGSEHQASDEVYNMIGMISQKSGCSFEFADVPEVMLQQFSEPIVEKETSNCDNGHLDNQPPPVDAASDGITISDHVSCNKGDTHSISNRNNSSGPSNEWQSRGLVEEGHNLNNCHGEVFQSFVEHHEEVSEESDEYHLDFQEKGMLAVDVYPSPRQSQISGSGDNSGSHKLTNSQENVFQNEASVSVDKFGDSGAENFGPFPCVGVDWEDHQETGERGCKSYASQLEAEQGVHDVHVIEYKSCEEQNENGNDFSQVGAVSVISRTNDLRFESDGNTGVDISRAHSSNSWPETEQNVHRSSSDLTGVLLHSNTSHENSSYSELRRSSMSAVGKERLKLETEVEYLRERLRIVQQGREKLNFSVENKDKENFQLQLLEEIASQLREIRQLTEPGMPIRQVSLPPPSSQVNSKKRRCRSVPWGVHGSS